MIALGYGVVAPAMPSFARTFGVSIEAVTFLVTVFSLSRMCFAPVGGVLVQRLGERRIYIGGLLVVALSTMACAFSQTYWQLLLFRVVSGIGSSLFFVSALGLMIHISPVDARGRVAGIFSTSFMVGVVCGPAIGGLATGWGWPRRSSSTAPRCWVWQWCCSTACGIRSWPRPCPRRVRR